MSEVNSNGLDSINSAADQNCPDKCRELFEEMAQGVFYQRADGTLVDVNPAALRMLGLTRDEFLGRTIHDLRWKVVDEEKAELPAGGHPSMIALATGKPIRGKLIGVFNPLENGYRWFIVNAIPQFKAGESKPYQVFVTLHDETELKRSRDVHSARAGLLRFSLGHTLEELLQATLDEAEKLTDSRIGFLHHMDEDQNTLTLQAWSTRTSREFCKAVGKGLHYPVAQAGVWVECIRQRNPVIHNDYASLAHKKGLPQGHAEVTRELVVPVFMGERIVAILGVGNKPQPYTDEDVKIVQLLADLSWDIADKKRMEESILKAETLLGAHLDNSPLAIIEFDPMFRVVRWSDAAQRLFGWSAEEVIGKAVMEMRWVHDDDVELVNQEMAGIFSGSRSRSRCNNRNYTRDGAILHCEWYNSGVYDENGKLLSLFSQVLDVTDRNHNEEALVRNKKQTEAIMLTAMDGYWVTSLEGRILEANNSVCQMLGYTQEELLAKSIKELEAIETPAEVDDRTQRMIRSGKDRFESKHRRKDGSVVDVEVSCNFQPWEGGRFIAFIRDITQRKLAEASRKEREKWLHDSQRAGRVGSYSYDMANDRWDSTPVMDEIFGIPEGYKKDFSGWMSLMAPDQFQRCRDYFAGLIAANGDIPFDIQYKIVRPVDGQERWLHGKGEFVKDASGKVAKLIGAISDITDMLSMNSALVESESRFSVFMENLPAAAFIKDGEGRILMANKFLRELMGGGDWLGKTTMELFPADVAKKMVADDISALEKGLTLRTEVLTDHKGRVRTFETYKFPISVADGKKLLGGVSVEITEKLRMQEHLFKTQKLESLGVLAGGIAHDFNNILTGILGNLSLASTTVAPDNPAKVYLEESEKATLRASHLSQQLLTFSRGGDPIKKTLDTGKLIDEAVSFALRGSNVKGVQDIPPDLWCLDADEGQINQVLNNLLINAKQAMPNGGHIFINASNEMIAGDTGEESFREGRYVRINVSDEGHGIPAENLSRVFDPYFSTKAGGTGLGLSSAYSIVKRHGGRLGVSSKVGKGSTFSVLLPASDQAPARAVESEAQPGQTHGGGRVLVMDDEEMILEMLSAMLMNIGFEAAQASDGASAIRIYREAMASGKPFDVVILDLTIPGGMGGKDAAAGILAIDPSAKLVVSSGYSDDPIVAEYKNHGFAASIAKPYTMAKLSSELSKLVSKRAAQCT